MYIYIYIYIYKYIYLHLHPCLFDCMCDCIHVHVHIHIFMCQFMYLHVMHIRIYVYTTTVERMVIFEYWKEYDFGYVRHKNNKVILSLLGVCLQVRVFAYTIHVLTHSISIHRKYIYTCI